ncbi:hypothetical protein D6D74_01490 [Moraxella catarrhalis]|uniref:Uncharacterized protein n=1 Tax=Moraxella catarrhalis TaxID=480 RepID=A0AB36DQF8_MORCA|nr:hypothetical protein [Moraxella catarrhalis]OAV26812.1 hypothetical protein AO370_0467 [Moraxella catarrhalis]RKL88226.1 hypothetical protein D6D65_03615 [Moraxella catarrhalis]RKL90038.1 hypothetical protein D6D77_03225 [Moraxella catarrhalis]RKM00607.1 hypothetical protein D6D74_01490 [Moraxella catarrhalis]
MDNKDKQAQSFKPKISQSMADFLLIFLLITFKTPNEQTPPKCQTLRMFIFRFKSANWLNAKSLNTSWLNMMISD